MKAIIVILAYGKTTGIMVLLSISLMKTKHQSTGKKIFKHAGKTINLV